MPQNEVSSRYRYLIGAPRHGRTHATIGTDMHRYLEVLLSQSTGPSTFVSEFAPVAHMHEDCEVLRRERFPERALQRVTPLIGAPIGDAPSDSLSPFSSFASYFESRRLDREFTECEITGALRAYQNSREYTAPVLSSRGILWPFTTLTV